jgi:hypothetical protein
MSPTPKENRHEEEPSASSGPLAAAGLAAGALGLAAAAKADDPVKAAPDLFSAHTGPALANAHLVDEPDRATNPGAGTAKLHRAG